MILLNYIVELIPKISFKLIIKVGNTLMKSTDLLGLFECMRTIERFMRNMSRLDPTFVDLQ